MTKLNSKLERKIIKEVFNILDKEIEAFNIEYDYIVIKILANSKNSYIKNTNNYTLIVRISKDKKFIENLTFLTQISRRITNKIKEINRVVYDITYKEGKEQNIYY